MPEQQQPSLPNPGLARSIWRRGTSPGVIDVKRAARQVEQARNQYGDRPPLWKAIQRRWLPAAEDRATGQPTLPLVAALRSAPEESQGAAASTAPGRSPQAGQTVVRVNPGAGGNTLAKKEAPQPLPAAYKVPGEQEVPVVRPVRQDREARPAGLAAMRPDSSPDHRAENSPLAWEMPAVLPITRPAGLPTVLARKIGPRVELPQPTAGQIGAGEGTRPVAQAALALSAREELPAPAPGAASAGPAAPMKWRQAETGLLELPLVKTVPSAVEERYPAPAQPAAWARTGGFPRPPALARSPLPVIQRSEARLASKNNRPERPAAAAQSAPADLSGMLQRDEAQASGEAVPLQPDLPTLAEQVSRIIQRQIAVERERRGIGRWH